MATENHTFLPAEWHPQSAVQLTWPHDHTDWAPILDQVTECYLHMAAEIARREHLIIVTPEPEHVKDLLTAHLTDDMMQHITLHQMPTNDTWARDHGFITLLGEEGPTLLDFQFNGWGQKFEATLDNEICRHLVAHTGTECLGQTRPAINGRYEGHLDFVLEGGSIESDGHGTILTTSQCLMAPHRNQPLTQEQIEKRLKQWLHAERILWLDYGYLAGDDTDSHIDTLARLCPDDTIAYVQCTDVADEHHAELQLMEEQLRSFRTIDGQPYRLIPLPMAAPAHDPEDGHRLPATYANFLIMNEAVLMPTYGHPELDEKAQQQLQLAFPHHQIVGIDCQALIMQHGSLHCCTMQFPAGVVR